MDAHSTVQTAAQIATAFGVLTGASQLFIARGQRTAIFEQEFTNRYREIDSRLPLWALIGASGAHEYSALNEEIRRAFYDYFELCEEEVLYADRISKKTLRDWYEGIDTNMRKPAFQAAWADISAAATEQFEKFRPRAASAGES